MAEPPKAGFVPTVVMPHPTGRPDSGERTVGVGRVRPAGPGRYALGELLGEGGMGSVYRATDPGTGTPVAVKLVRADVWTPEHQARFDAERRALARMDHPNVARLLDSGTTADGRPYFAMPFVDGPPLTRYADTHRLSIDARLELLAAVCDGVQHAHQKGVIHRDLKPSNVLVAEDAGRPVPVVIDFGLVKEADAGDGHTVAGMVIGTPQYMAPEQAAGTPDAIDTRTDVYALGAMLYELLAGAVPFAGPSGVRTPTPELLARVRYDDPPTLAGKVRAGDPAAVAAARGTTPDRLARRLRGDLERVARKALAKERDARYPSAAALAEDVRRVLAGQPVSVAAPGAVVQLRAFARRNKRAVATAAVVLLAMVAGGAAAAVGFVRASAAEKLATDRLAELERALAKAEAAARRAKDEADMEALDRLAAYHNSTDGYRLAADLLERVVAAADALHGPGHAWTVDRRATLAGCYRRLGRTDDWAGALGRAVAGARAAHGPGSPVVAWEGVTLAEHYAETGRKADALALADEFRPALLGPGRLAGFGGDPFEPWEVLAGVYAKAGRPADAVALMTDALACRRRDLPDDWDVEYTRSRLAAALTAAGRYAEAEPHATEAFDRLVARRAEVGRPYPRIIWKALDRAVKLYVAWGRPDKAAEWRAKARQLPLEPAPQPRAVSTPEPAAPPTE